MTDETMTTGETKIALSVMADTIQSWLDWQKQERDREGLPTDADSKFLCFQMPVHPPRAMFENWLLALKSAHEFIDDAQDAAAEAKFYHR